MKYTKLASCDYLIYIYSHLKNKNSEESKT